MFSVDTVEEAEAIRIRFCKLGYDGKTWRWTGFPTHDYKYLGVVSDQIRVFYESMKVRKEGK